MNRGRNGLLFNFLNLTRLTDPSPHFFYRGIRPDQDQQNDHAVNPPRNIFSGKHQIYICRDKEKHCRESGQNDRLCFAVITNQTADRSGKKRNRADVNRPENKWVYPIFSAQAQKPVLYCFPAHKFHNLDRDRNYSPLPQLKRCSWGDTSLRPTKI